MRLFTVHAVRFSLRNGCTVNRQANLFSPRNMYGKQTSKSLCMYGKQTAK